MVNLLLIPRFRVRLPARAPKMCRSSAEGRQKGLLLMFVSGSADALQLFRLMLDSPSHDTSTNNELRPAKMQQDRHYPPVVVRCWFESELAENASDMRLDSSFAHMQSFGDRLVRAPLRHQRKDLPLAIRQLLQRALRPAATHQPGHHLGVQHRPTSLQTLQGVEQLVCILHTVLQQIPDAPLRAGDQFRRKVSIDVCGEHQHANVGPTPVDLSCSRQTFVRVGGRHSDVDDHYVRLLTREEIEELLSVARLTHHCDAGFPQEADQSAAEQSRVVGDGYPHGISACTNVPAAEGLAISSFPPSTETRSAMPVRPEPLPGAAPPRPSSRTSTHSRSSCCRTETSTRRAPECLAALVRASLTTK